MRFDKLNEFVVGVLLLLGVLLLIDFLFNSDPFILGLLGIGHNNFFLLVFCEVYISLTIWIVVLAY